jgi:3,4-dihydroxy 2-butanone 4-phosphate synthase / GTP cyclohydrolase II
VSKKTKASTRQIFATNSNSNRVRSVGLRVASSFKQDDGFLADGVSIAHWYPSKRKYGVVL